MRALLAHHQGRRQRSGVPGAVGARRRRRARVRCARKRAAAADQRLDASRSSGYYRTVHSDSRRIDGDDGNDAASKALAVGSAVGARAGPGGRCHRRRPGPQVVDARGLPHPGQGPRGRDALPRPGVREEHGRQLRPVPAGTARGSGCWRALPPGRACHGRLAGARRHQQAGGGQPRPDHGRGRQQCHRPADLGGVADFFSLHAFGFYWYVFNIADVAIVAGVIGLLYDSFGPSRKDASKAM